MWICKLTFENGNSSDMQANTLEGIIQAIHDVVYVWKAPVTSIGLMRIKADQIKQGRPCEYVC